MINFELNQQIGNPVDPRLISRTLKQVDKNLKIKKNIQISVAFVDNQSIKKLNSTYRGKDQVTDVLSFSENDSQVTEKFFVDKNYLGEVIICYPRAVIQAKENKNSLSDEIKLLLIHGVLHLFGYNHEENKEASVMRSLENKILGKKLASRL